MTIENVKNSNCNSHNFPIPSLEILFNYEWYRDDPVTAHMMEAKECLSKWSKPALVMFSTKWDFARCWSYLAHFVGTEPNKPNIEVLTHHVPPGTQWLVGRTKSSWSWSLMQRKRWSTSFGLKREFKLVTFCLSNAIGSNSWNSLLLIGHNTCRLWRVRATSSKSLTGRSLPTTYLNSLKAKIKQRYTWTPQAKIKLRHNHAFDDGAPTRADKPDISRWWTRLLTKSVSKWGAAQYSESILLAKMIAATNLIDSKWTESEFWTPLQMFR